MEMQHQDHTECGIGDNNSSSPMVEPQSSPPQPSSASHLQNTTSTVFTRCGRESSPSDFNPTAVSPVHPRCPKSSPCVSSLIRVYSPTPLSLVQPLVSLVQLLSL
ncbi:hypothetical protein PoB_003224600 [Plakobranchus ocellatus]|uniref:Uncharacterized protein n=1 Tax=Plakobranchus ocellatus TaxID=259542 RepID=A0AAV4A394_9GAST|nr:hypothetical protein PoB_003224600 [Plakobranchus ocellatus]